MLVYKLFLINFYIYILKNPKEHNCAISRTANAMECDFSCDHFFYFST